MTIRDAILSFPGISDGEEFLNKVIVDRSVDRDDYEYTSSHSTIVNLIAADVYAMIGGLPDFTENKLSIRYPRSWYTQKAKELYLENGEPEKAMALGNGIRVPRGRAPQSW